MAAGVAGLVESVLSLCPASVFLGCVLLLAALLVLGAAWGPSPGSTPPVPCLPWVPLLGSLPWLGGGQPPHLLFTRLAHRYGPLYAMYLGPHYTLVVNDYQHAREVLLQRGKDYAGRPKMVTTELLTRGGKDIAFADYSSLWRSHRRLVHQAFTLFGEGSHKLQDIVLEEVESLCCSLQASGGRAVDPAPAVTRAVTNVVCTLVFSSTYRHDDPELTQVMEYNDGIVETIARGGLVDIYPWLRIFPSRALRKLKQCISVRDRLLNRKLEEHKASMRTGEPRDLLDALLQGSGVSQGSGAEEGVMSDDHVIMTAAETFGAGVETTSTTLLWCLAFLLHHPQVQERVQSELEECVGGGRTVCVSHRASLPYLDSVINEVMRIRPVSPVLIPHTTLTHTSLGGYSIRKDTRVLVNMWAIHHDPHLWDQPEHFRPERFLDDQGQRSVPSCFLPFGAGPRVCVGESLARMELFLFLANLLQRFSFSPAPGVSLPDLQGKLGVVLQPIRYTLTVSPRVGGG
ncbi:cytochrome P450 17A2 [Osmerus mordax]|uniref:cytochrome P450 17A2 n=1 Tax=Osmerus mordax TaxID=8014 RepID=UPI00350F7D8F